MAIASSTNKIRKRRGGRLMSEINVTPMVDVMLVLLIIFMITAPMLVTGIEVELPSAEAPPIKNQTQPLVITIDKRGKVFIAETEISKSEFATKLKNIKAEKYDNYVVIRCDKNSLYGWVFEIMAKINQAGFSKVTFMPDSQK